MIGRVATIAALGAWAVLFSLPASSCDISLRNVRGVSFDGAQRYQVFGTHETAQVVSFQVRHANNQPPCGYFITFSRGGAVTYDRRMTHAGNEIHYQLYDSAAKANVLKELPDAAGNEVLAGAFTTTAAETQDLTYFAAIAAGQIVPPVNYRDDIIVRLYEGTLASPIERDSAAVRVTANINSELGVCVGCANAFDPNAHTQNLNFGTLEEGESRTSTLRARSNEGYTLFMQSENRGVMRHTVLAASVPYAIEVNGATVDLTPRNRTEVARVPGITGLDGDPFDVRVTIGSLANAVAGDYQDFITVTLTAY